MMQFDKFTEKAQEVAQISAAITERYDHNLIDTEHMLLALLEQHNGQVSQVLEKMKVNVNGIRERLEASLRASTKTKKIGNGKQLYITPRVKRIVDLANDEAKRMHDESISTEHLFLSILTERKTPAARILEAGGITRTNVLATIEGIRDGKLKRQVKRRIEKSSSKVKSTRTNNNVFVVHGHDDAMKEAVARAIEKMGLHAIILHEKPNHGKTIIEKFTNYSDVGFAIVLLSPDDIASSKHDSSEKKLFRARQNVIFELGFFIGKLGRERVIALYRQTDEFDLPSDYSGVLYIPFDDYNRWKFDVIRELKASGYKLDANKLLE